MKQNDSAALMTNDECDAQSTQRIIASESLALEASQMGLSERYGRGKTSHTLQVWWARRPHAAMRSVCFASIAEGTDENLRNLSSLFSDDLSTPREKSGINHDLFQNSAVLDFFGGGGTIPFEAARLGSKSIAIDYNPLSVFIQNVNLVLSQRAFRRHGKQKTLDVLAETGARVLNNVKDQTSSFYPGRAAPDDLTVFAYFWTYKKACSSCGHKYTLQKRPWLSKKKGRTTFLSIHEGVWSVNGDGAPGETNWVGRNGSTQCPNCGAVEKGADIRLCDDDLIALGKIQKPRGKSFEPAISTDFYPKDIVDEAYERLVLQLGEMPKTDVPKWSGIVNPAIYGIAEHHDVLNKRQKVLLLTLIKELRTQFSAISEDYDEVLAQFIIGALMGLVDQIVDWNSRLSMWIPQNEQVGRGFCGPGIAMLWDYVETDQLLSGPANLWDKLKRIENGVSEIPEFQQIPIVKRATAQKTGLESRSIDAIVTDPPYYDNMFYNTLADFFYVWKRYGFKDLFPGFFDLEMSEFQNELVASSKRQGSSDAAHRWYVSELSKAMSEARRVLKDDGVVSFVYGHSSLSGWAAVVEAFKQAKLAVVNVQPLSIERRARPRAMTSEAVNTCLVLVAMKKELSQTNIDDPIRTGSELTKMGWSNADAGMAAFAASLSNIINEESVISESEIRSAIRSEADAISAEFEGFKINNRKSI